jgi:hypothetical protein
MGPPTAFGRTWLIAVHRDLGDMQSSASDFVVADSARSLENMAARIERCRRRGWTRGDLLPRVRYPKDSA